MEKDSVFLYHPMVALAQTSYQIFFNTRLPGMGWAEVEGRRFYDEAAGLIRSDRTIHRVVVPAPLLDRARSYAVCFQPVVDRKPYYPQTGPVERRNYSFRPVDWSDGLQLYQLADTHAQVERPVAAARRFGDRLDLLVFNGDIDNHADSQSEFFTAFDIASRLTEGSRPVIYARGNHDTRGHAAPQLLEYIPTVSGDTFYTFRTGPLWGLVLDCGEDKGDGQIEYGGVVAFDGFRRRETAFLRQVLAEGEWEDPAVRLKLAICHIPFTEDLGRNNPIFGIGNEYYGEWVELLNRMGVQLLLCGHMHRTYFTRPGDCLDFRGQRFPTAVGSDPSCPTRLGEGFLGLALETGPELDAVAVSFTDSAGEERDRLEL